MAWPPRGMLRAQMDTLPAEPGPVDALCRLTVCGPARRVELAVPVYVPLIDLLPAMLGHSDENLAGAGLDHEGWVPRLLLAALVGGSLAVGLVLLAGHLRIISDLAV